MDPKDKIDLRSLNKTKKQLKLPRPTNPFKKSSAGPGRDAVGRFASAGFKSNNRWFNNKIVTVVVLLIAGVGGFYVYKSNAATGNIFDKPATQLTGGKLTTKSDGKQYRFNNTSDISTTLTLAQMNTAKQFCAYVKTVADSYVFITVNTTPVDKANNTVLTRAKTTLVPKDKSTEVCTTTVTNVSNTVSGGKVTVGTAKFDSSGNFVSTTKSTVGVENIYGRSETTLPTVSISAPVNNATVSGSAVNLAATATDNLGVSKVEFKIGSTLVGTDTTSPYSYSWNSTTRSNGSHTLSVTAYDVAGNSKTTSIAITVSNALDTTLPTVSITAPGATSTVSGTAVNFAATATDNVGVAKVEFKIGGVRVSTDTTSPYSYIWNSTTSSGPSAVLEVVAYDAAGNLKSASHGVFLSNTDTTVPTVSVTAPTSNATASGTAVNLAATATDNVGVTKVEFKIDNALTSTDTTSPYSYNWNSTSSSNANHTVSATAYDAAGNAKTTSVVFRVNNTSGEVKIVYAGANFLSSDTSFSTFVTNQISLLLSYAPFSTHKDNITFRSVNVGTVPCQSTTGTSDGRTWSCDYTLVAQRLAAAGVPYDKVVVVNNSSVYGGSGQRGGTFATGNARSSANGVDYGQALTLHEMSHTFGLMDEYSYAQPGYPPVPSSYTNCFDGRTTNPYFTSTSQRISGCARDDWYKSSPDSIMNSLSGPGSSYFSPAAVKMLDTVLRSYL